MELLPEALAAILGALVGWGTQLAARFSKTSHGPNPWDLPSYVNAVRVAPHVEKAIAMLNGEIDSMFRSPMVNAQIPGSASNSYHQHGLAVDVKPGVPWRDVEAAFRFAVSQVKLGVLGPVRTVIWEPSWVHFDWFKTDEPHRPTNFFRKVGDAYTKVEGL